MTTQANKAKLTKSKATLALTHAKLTAARNAYDAAHSAWVSRKDHGSASYDVAFRDLHSLKVEMNKWWGEYSKALGRVYA